MRAFLDFEASSLGKHGVPIEVAWVFEDGRSASYLIRPADGWDDWDPQSQAIHGITRATLIDEGVAHDAVARAMVEGLVGHDLFASAPSWDGKWLSLLLRAAGFPRHTLRLRDSEQARCESARAILAERLSGPALVEASTRVLGEAQKAARARPVRHRALANAQAERDWWRDVADRSRRYLAAD